MLLANGSTKSRPLKGKLRTETKEISKKNEEQRRAIINCEVSVGMLKYRVGQKEVYVVHMKSNTIINK